MFDLGALLMSIGKNPDMATQLDSLGVPAPHPDMMKLGGPSPQDTQAAGVPGVQSPGTTQAPSEDVGLGSWIPTVTQASPDSAPPAKPATGSNLDALASLKGIVAPTPAPYGPTGVNGGVKPPGMKSSQGGSALLNTIMAALLTKHDQNPLRVPDLGSFIRGGKY